MYHEIASNLIDAIQNGDFKDKLPTEQQLMAKYGVSRNTIRRAIDVVYQQGLLRRVQGSGYFVNHTPLREKTTINLSVGAGISTLPERLTSRIVSFDQVLAKDIALAHRLQIDLNADLYRVIRLRYLRKQLYCYEEAYYIRELIPFLSPESVNSSIYEFILETYNLGVTATDDIISMTHLSLAEATLMEMAEKTARLVLEQTNYTRNNQIFNFARTIYASPDLRFYMHSGHLASS